MNTFETKVIRGLLLTVLIGLLMACGGGSGGSASPSEPVVARGVITEMGSIWVNGVEYETPVGGTYSNDDDISNTANYEVGQVVSIRGRRNPDGVSGTATEVRYEPEIEGAASAGNTINGVTIITDQSLIVDTGYEVSGFWLNKTTIQATSIGPDDGDMVDEVRGEVDVVVPATSITVNNVVYLWAGASDFSEGNIVEVHFIPTSGPPFQATDVQLEDDFFDNPVDGQEAEIEGPVNLTVTDIANCPFIIDRTTVFMIGKDCIDWSSVPSDGWQDGLTDERDLVSGLRVEAEGHYNADDLLIAEKIKGRGNQVRISAIASSIVLDTAGTTGSLVVFAGVTTPIDVTFESGLTEIDFNGVTNLLGANLTAEGLEIRGIRIDETSVLALRIKKDSVNPNRQELRAEVDDDGANPTLDTITVMGISSLLDINTQLEEEDSIISAGGTTTPAQIAAFLSPTSIDDDGIVAIGNGPNDVVEVRIDLSGVGSNGSLGNPYTAKQVEIEREDD